MPYVSVSVSLLDKMVRYIRTQPEDHRKMTFQREFLALVKKGQGGRPASSQKRPRSGGGGGARACPHGLRGQPSLRIGVKLGDVGFPGLFRARCGGMGVFCPPPSPSHALRAWEGEGFWAVLNPGRRPLRGLALIRFPKLFTAERSEPRERSGARR
jgi:hypothetical protein